MVVDQTQVADAVRTLSGFTPGAPFWRVNREWLISLGGARAVLLELAHPLVAEGVAAHSRYRTDPFGRLFRTMRTMTDLTFGGRAAAQRAAWHFRGSHQRVRGALAAGIGPFEAGTPYAAHDPFLKLWVLATLIDSVLQVYERFVRPLSEDDRERYYQDAQRLAEWLGLSPALMPATFADFQAYLGAMLASDLLTVGGRAREIVTALYGAPVFGGLAWRASYVSVGLLPARLRAAFGFAWTSADDQRLERLGALSRRLRPWLPDLLLVHPTALRAEIVAIARSHLGMAELATRGRRAF